MVSHKTLDFKFNDLRVKFDFLPQKKSFNGMQRFDKVINKVCKDLKMIKLEYEKRPEGCKDIKIGKFEYERTDLLQLQGSKHV